MSTLNQKTLISLQSAFTFMKINSPSTYKFISKITKLNLYDSEKGCPTQLGLIVHTLIFFAISYFSMYKSGAENGIKIKHSLYGTLIFYFISSPAVFSVVRKILGDKLSTNEGCPSKLGIFVHSIIYFLALIGVMYLPSGDK
tara:strand:+ start:121 stop:546 length:426 start_codon:yes stop_codon:yes gene_type:complete